MDSRERSTTRGRSFEYSTVLKDVFLWLSKTRINQEKFENLKKMLSKRILEVKHDWKGILDILSDSWYLDVPASKLLNYCYDFVDITPEDLNEVLEEFSDLELWNVLKYGSGDSSNVFLCALKSQMGQALVNPVDGWDGM